MKTFAVAALALLLLAPLAAASDSMTAGSVTLTLGMSEEALRAQLPQNVRIEWQRDRLPQPVTAKKTDAGVRDESDITVAGKPTKLRYDDEHGAHAWLATTSGEPLAALVFENGKLTRATRILGTTNPGAVPAPGMLSAVAAILEQWGDSVRVRASHEVHGRDAVDQIVFESGSRQLVILSSPAGMQVVENLGRGDIPTVTIEQ